MILDIIFLIAGLIILIYGANMLVDGGSALAHKLNISAMVIGLTVRGIWNFHPRISGQHPVIGKRQFGIGSRQYIRQQYFQYTGYFRNHSHFCPPECAKDYHLGGSAFSRICSRIDIAYGR